MKPVVDGLEDKYQDQVEFRRLDANSPSGKTAFQAFALRGHPGFVLMSQDGMILWKAVGQLPVESLEDPILSAINNNP